MRTLSLSLLTGIVLVISGTAVYGGECDGRGKCKPKSCSMINTRVKTKKNPSTKCKSDNKAIDKLNTKKNKPQDKIDSIKKRNKTSNQNSNSSDQQTNNNGTDKSNTDKTTSRQDRINQVRSKSAPKYNSQAQEGYNTAK